MDSTPLWFMIVQAIGVAAVVFTFIVYAFQLAAMRKQIQVMEKGTANQQYFELLRYVNDFRSDREIVLLAHKEGRSFDKWTSAEVASGERVCASFNTAGILAKEGMIPEKLIIDAWYYSAPACYTVLEGMILKYRESRGAEYWDRFEWLVKRIQQDAAQQPTVPK